MHKNQSGSALIIVIIIIIIISGCIIEYKTINWQQQKLFVFEQQRMVKVKQDKFILKNIIEAISAYEKVENIADRFDITKPQVKINLIKISEIKKDKVICKAYKAKINRFIDLAAGDQYHDKLYIMACTQDLEYRIVGKINGKNTQAMKIIPITNFIES